MYLHISKLQTPSHHFSPDWKHLHIFFRSCPKVRVHLKLDSLLVTCTPFTSGSTYLEGGRVG